MAPFGPEPVIGAQDSPFAIAAVDDQIVTQDLLSAHSGVFNLRSIAL